MINMHCCPASDTTLNDKAAWSLWSRWCTPCATIPEAFTARLIAERMLNWKQEQLMPIGVGVLLKDIPFCPLREYVLSRVDSYVNDPMLSGAGLISLLTAELGSIARSSALSLASCT